MFGTVGLARESRGPPLWRRFLEPVAVERDGQDMSASLDSLAELLRLRPPHVAVWKHLDAEHPPHAGRGGVGPSPSAAAQRALAVAVLSDPPFLRHESGAWAAALLAAATDRALRSAEEGALTDELAAAHATWTRRALLGASPDSDSADAAAAARRAADLAAALARRRPAATVAPVGFEAVRTLSWTRPPLGSPRSPLLFHLPTSSDLLAGGTGRALWPAGVAAAGLLLGGGGGGGGPAVAVAGADVLVLGCGVGLEALAARAAGASRVVAVDASAEALEGARAAARLTAGAEVRAVEGAGGVWAALEGGARRGGGAKNPPPPALVRCKIEARGAGAISAISAISAPVPPGPTRPDPAPDRTCRPPPPPAPTPGTTARRWSSRPTSPTVPPWRGA